MRIKGKLTSWNDKKGYGFISPDTGESPVFIHINAFYNRKRRPEVNQLIDYILSTDNKGRICAMQATYANERPPKNPILTKKELSISGAIFFLTFVGFYVFIIKTPMIIFGLYCGASLLTFILYAVDKEAATQGKRRIQESRLHILSLIGGWPGALIAQQVLRHKSQKQPFRLIFWLTVLLNCGVFFWLLSPKGSSLLQSFINRIADTLY